MREAPEPDPMKQVKLCPSPLTAFSNTLKQHKR
ncbi:hypothetical protein ES319_D01G089700v1 [Gossypium barbadense]|uniref:Uncharacterized protein n=1 Tax=Gossypium barbadense TaxID=3634 RepID=A0A5J5SLE8_GOSBA|nr:hypothetical protein ES319_D01G089700v1 [Gossypium barbadense]